MKAARPIDALWAMEEALKCRALSAVIAELTDDAPLADLTATRRLALAAREGGGLRLSAAPSRLASTERRRNALGDRRRARSSPIAFGGLGRTAFSLSLLKNRRGPTGRWTIAWDHHERTFSPLSLGVAETALDRPDRAPLVRAG